MERLWTWTDGLGAHERSLTVSRSHNNFAQTFGKCPSVAYRHCLASSFVCNGESGTQAQKELIRVVMQRWRTERIYEDLKGELGFDHFEGRSFPGWHHHVSVVLCCYAFVIAERVRSFPPSASGAPQDDAHDFAA